MRALVFGTLNPDLVHLVDALPGPGDDIRSRSWSLTWGGKAANAAVALARWGIETALTGLVLGTDPLGDVLLDALDQPGLDLSMIERDPGERTRHCLVLVTADGDRAIVCTDYQDARWTIPPDAALEVDVVLLDGFGGQAAADLAARAASRSIPVVWLDAPATATAALVVWSRHEHDPDQIEAVVGAGSDLVVTDGPRPVVAWIGGTRHQVSPPSIPIADSTGAGDVFAAACAFGLAAGWPAPRLLGWAAAAASLAAGRGRGGLPTTAAVDALV